MVVEQKKTDSSIFLKDRSAGKTFCLPRSLSSKVSGCRVGNAFPGRSPDLFQPCIAFPSGFIRGQWHMMQVLYPAMSCRKQKLQWRDRSRFSRDSQLALNRHLVSWTIYRKEGELSSRCLVWQLWRMNFFIHFFLIHSNARSRARSISNEIQIKRDFLSLPPN